MADLYLDWNSDLQLTPGGDLKLVDGPDLTRQRIIRRLLTPVRGYLWHLEYGAGIPQKIGNVGTTTTIGALIRANISIEPSVASYPVPQISVQQGTAAPGLFLIRIGYFDAVLGRQATLSFDTTGQTIAPALLLG